MQQVSWGGLLILYILRLLQYFTMIPALHQDRWARGRFRTRDLCLSSMARYLGATTSTGVLVYSVQLPDKEGLQGIHIGVSDILTGSYIHSGAHHHPRARYRHKSLYFPIISHPRFSEDNTVNLISLEILVNRKRRKERSVFTVVKWICMRLIQFYLLTRKKVIKVIFCCIKSKQWDAIYPQYTVRNVLSNYANIYI